MDFKPGSVDRRVIQQVGQKVRRWGRQQVPGIDRGRIVRAQEKLNPTDLALPVPKEFVPQ